MSNKQSFYESINKDIEFNESLFKKVYGYSVCDNLFLPAVATKLIDIGRKDIVQAYNKWFANWQQEYNKMLKGVAQWQRKEFDKQFEEFKREQQGKAVDGWKQKRKLDLLQKSDRELLNLLQSMNPKN